jgi:hypothetical protein
LSKEAASIPLLNLGGAYEKVVGLTIDRSSPIRPHVEFAPHSSGSKVKVVTRLSPADRISKMPANMRGELSESFLGDSENESNPQTMEFAADMGDRLKDTRGTTKIEMKGRDPATLARIKTVDQWVGDQQSKLDKLGTTRQAKFTRLLSDIRRVGVTGPVEAEDLSAQDIELVLAGAAGGQSDFRAFDEFKRGTNWELRSGKISLPAEAADITRTSSCETNIGKRGKRKPRVCAGCRESRPQLRLLHSWRSAVPLSSVPARR